MATGTLLTISIKKGVVFIVFKCFDAALHVACEMVVGQEVVNSVHVLGSSLLSHQLPQNECHQGLEGFIKAAHFPHFARLHRRISCGELTDIRD